MRTAVVEIGETQKINVNVPNWVPRDMDPYYVEAYMTCCSTPHLAKMTSSQRKSWIISEMNKKVEKENYVRAALHQDTHWELQQDGVLYLRCIYKNAKDANDFYNKLKKNVKEVSKGIKDKEQAKLIISEFNKINIVEVRIEETESERPHRLDTV